MTPPLIIFDCDGILVDSEIINSQVFYELILEEGIDISYETLHEDMLGGALHVTMTFLENTYNKKISSEFIPEFRKRTFERFKSNLKPIDGIIHSLDKLTHSKCVASNGPGEKIRLNLGITGILPRFNDTHIFSAYDIKTWKPEPDLFLYAAKNMNYAPENAIIVEDSANGIQAAKKANMKVIAYAVKEKKAHLQALNPDLLIEDMHDLADAIKKLS